MLYAIIGKDNEDSLGQRRIQRPAHLQRLAELRDQGRLILAGPFPNVDGENPGAAGYTGSLIVAEFPSLADAQSWADRDPYLQSGVYKDVTVRPFIAVLP